MRLISLNVPGDVYRKLKEESNATGVTLTDIVTEELCDRYNLEHVYKDRFKNRKTYDESLILEENKKIVEDKLREVIQSKTEGIYLGANIYFSEVGFNQKKEFINYYMIHQSQFMNLIGDELSKKDIKAALIDSYYIPKKYKEKKAFIKQIKGKSIRIIPVKASIF